MLPDFIPLENTPMPVVTALVFSFLSFILYYGGKYLISKNNQQDKRLSTHDSILSGVQGDSRETRVILERMEATVNGTLEGLVNTNRLVVEKLLKEDK